MIELSDIRCDLDDALTESSCLARCRDEAARVLGIKAGKIQHLELARKSIDARKKSHVHFILSARLSVGDSAVEQIIVDRVAPSDKRRVRIVEDTVSTFPHAPQAASDADISPVVVGAGCAGLFAALTLAEAGLKPLLIERGENARRRLESIERFHATGDLDPESNIQFGLGGAGTFSDGKLTTGTKNKSHRLILSTFVEAGAPRDILWDAKPHIGSDILPAVVTSLVERIERLGGTVRFGCRMVDISTDPNGSVTGILVDTQGSTEYLPASHLILACGHSARDVFELLADRKFELRRKTFAMGVRIEHEQAAIDRAQYGTFAGHPALGASPYKLVAHTNNGRSLFSFCMCPGGLVVAAASEPEGVVVNGASLFARDGSNANAALLVNIDPEDLPGENPLEGMYLQRRIEQAAFKAGGQSYRAPAQLVGDFLHGKPSHRGGRIKPTYPLGVNWTDLSPLLPPHVTETLRLGIPMLDKKLHGFNDQEAVLTGVETRSSSPVTVVRNKDCRSTRFSNVYPCGEGAGYAGGIMSAATDGIRCATALIESLA